VHKLVYGCKESNDLLTNKVHFITFNYDTSLESHLSRSLEAIHMLDPSHVQTFLEDHRIIHVYGSVGQRPKGGRPNCFNPAGTLTRVGATEGVKEMLDEWRVAAQQIRTIDPHDKETDGDSCRARS
jgi:hypothetical protein